MAAIQLDPNFVYATLKVGNKHTSPDKPKHLGMKDGMIVDYIDPSEWSERIYHSDHMQKVYALVKLPRSWKSTLIDTVQPVEMSGGERERSGYINLSELENSTGIDSLESNLRNTGTVPIIDGTSLRKSLIKFSSLKKWDKIKDVNAVSAGTYDVGSGGDYTTWASAYADLANLTGNLTWTQTSNTTDTGIASLTESLGGFTLKMTAGTMHDGDPTAGFIADINHAGHAFSFGQEGAGITEIDGNYFRRVTTSSVNSIFYFIGIVTEYTSLFHDILIDLNGALGRYAVRSSDVTPLYHFYNWVVWDSGRETFAIDANDGNASNIFENMTLLNCGRQGINLGSNGGTVRNCYVEGNVPTYPSFANHGSATGRNNAGTGTSAADANWSAGSNNIATEVATTQFTSTSDASSDFAKVIEGSLSTAGVATAISGNDHGIRRNSRSASTPSIGADEFPAVVAATATSGAASAMATMMPPPSMINRR